MRAKLRRNTSVDDISGETAKESATLLANFGTYKNEKNFKDVTNKFCLIFHSIGVYTLIVHMF